MLSLWAGVEKIVGNASLTQPLCRMVDSGLRQGMVEWVVGHTLRYHLGMDQHIVNPDHIWREIHPPLAQDRPITILGLGALGQACAAALTALKFPVSGWSRRAKKIDGLTCHHGPSGLQAALQSAEILILLLPDTPQTEHVINTQTLAQMPRGAVIINPGRGPLIDDHALLAALEQKHISAACLDVFRVEPLPQDHPYWHLPNVTVTPHIASGTRPATAAEVLVENIVRGEAARHFCIWSTEQRGIDPPRAAQLSQDWRLASNASRRRALRCDLRFWQIKAQPNFNKSRHHCVIWRQIGHIPRRTIQL